MPAEIIKFAYISKNGRRVVHREVVAMDRGFIRYVIMKDDPTYDNYIELRQIYINEGHRKKGYGKKFIRFLVKVARENDIKVIYVASTVREDEVFGQFLIATGFKRVGSRVITEMPHFQFKKTIRKYVRKK